MENILKEINAVRGVTGCFVCNRQGEIVATDLPTTIEESILATIGRTAIQTLSGIETIRRRKVNDFVLVFQQASFITKNLGEGCLFILGTRNLNVSLLNLTANLAAKRLIEQLKSYVPVEKKAKPPELTLVSSGEGVDKAFFDQMEHELTKIMGPVAPLILDNELESYGAKRDSLPVTRLVDFVEKVSTAIPDEVKRANFMKLMLKVIESVQSVAGKME